MSSSHAKNGKSLRHQPIKKARLKKCRATNKVRFNNKVDAQIALANATRPTRRNEQTRPKGEKRTYQCPACKGWHLTSRETWRDHPAG